MWEGGGVGFGSFLLCLSHLKDFVNLREIRTLCKPSFKSHLAETFSAYILIQVYISPEAPVKELSVQKPKS